MKKICLFLLLFIPMLVRAEEINLAENAKSAILIVVYLLGNILKLIVIISPQMKFEHIKIIKENIDL